MKKKKLKSMKAYLLNIASFFVLMSYSNEKKLFY